MIVQQTRKVVRRDFDTGNEEETSERIWNPVIADITLLALGTSAPQISLAIIDAVQQLGQITSQGIQCLLDTLRISFAEDSLKLNHFSSMMLQKPF